MWKFLEENLCKIVLAVSETATKYFCLGWATTCAHMDYVRKEFEIFPLHF